MSEYRSNRDRGEGREPREGGRRFVSRPKFCQFCSDPKIVIDYKNVELMTRFINETGKIRPRRQTGTCALHQREVAKAIKNARHIALIPFEGDLWADNN
jgi:small subunit ribosomal protein S18